MDAQATLAGRFRNSTLKRVNRPNLLIFMTDHQRGDTVTAGSPVIKPNIDRFAAGGLRFSQAYCPSPHCCPSRATFMTGLYPSRHGVWNNICNDQALSRGIRRDTRCWSDDLKDAGYHLAYTGKWHVSTDESPRDRGFEELGQIKGIACDEHADHWRAYEELAAEPEATKRREGEILRPGYGSQQVYKRIPKQPQGQGHDVHVVGRAIEALPRLASRKDPWAMFVGCSMPHDPYNVPGEYLDRYNLDDIPLPPSYADQMTDKPAIVQRLREQIWGQLSEREVRDAIRHFWAMCTWLDELFGEMLAALDKTGQADDTLVLYLSDHGDYCGDHGLFSKGIPAFRGAYHLPAIARWPRGIKQPGRTVSQFVSLADFAPTFTELAGKTPDASLTGRSLVPFLRGETPPDWRDEIHTQCNGVELYYSQRSVSTDRWKYVFNGFDRDELYDLQADPHEMKNLAADPAMQPIIREMCGRMWRFAKREHDSAINAYITVGLAPFGPAEAFRGE